MEKTIEIWADSFHEGNWCCDCIADIARIHGYSIGKSYLRGFQPCYRLENGKNRLELIVYGSYRSWNPVPKKIGDLIRWGKPDFVAYDANSREILFAVEETAATPTGNQAMQRCERQYGSARFRIPYWYLISEYGLHRDGGVRRDSIWPTIAALKLSIYRRTPCVVLHYSDINNPEDYSSGKGVDLLFRSLFAILVNHLEGRSRLDGLASLLAGQYREMLGFLASQWKSIIDFLPGENMVKAPETASYLAELAVGDETHSAHMRGFLSWPVISGVPEAVRRGWVGKPLLKNDPLCSRFERDIDAGKAYYLSDNAGSGKPPTTQQIEAWIGQQRALFALEKKLSPPADFTMKIEDFPDTGTGSGRRHLTTAKNIVYLYDSWNTLADTISEAYPRLKGHLTRLEKGLPVFVYVCNSIKPGRLFGDPFTGQLAAFSTAFGKFDPSPRMVVAYYPHQVHTQVLHCGMVSRNKGTTLMAELADYLIFNAGVAVDLKGKRVM